MGKKINKKRKKELEMHSNERKNYTKIKLEREKNI